MSCTEQRLCVPFQSSALPHGRSSSRDRPLFVVGNGAPPAIAAPAWLSRLAIAERVTPALVELVCEGLGEQPPKDIAGFLAALEAGGVLRGDDDDPAGATFLLDEDRRKAMLQELDEAPGGIRQIRDDVIRIGLAGAPHSLSGQLAIWAHENADWTALSELWMRYPPAIWSTMPQSAVRVFAQVPPEARREHPALSQAAAMTAALNPDRAGTFSEQAVRTLRQDGRLLHSGWASHRSLDAALRAGSIWMMAQRTMDGHPDPLDDAWATREAISVVIDRQTHAGNAPRSSAQTLFHAVSAITALLRGDLFQARSDCEQAVMLGRPGDIWALVGAAVEALVLSIAGNPRGVERAAEAYNAQAPACGAFADIAAPYLHLALAHTAVRVLDRERAEEALALAAALEEGSEFWSAYAWIRSMHDLTWRKPDFGLARLEAAVATNPSALKYATISDALAIRAKADLLCCAGRIHEAESLLKSGAESRLSDYLLVSEARMHLCGNDGAQAIRIAETGVHDPSIHAPARAHLHAIRSAGLLLDGAEEDAVAEALHEACVLCTEMSDVLPLVFIPAKLRSDLLARHDRLEHAAPCILDDVVVRERLNRVHDNLDAAPTVIHLTGREQLLLPLLATSDTVDAIARELQVSVNTLRKQVATLRHKFGAPTREAMIATAHELGLLAGR